MFVIIQTLSLINFAVCCIYKMFVGFILTDLIEDEALKIDTGGLPLVDISDDDVFSNEKDTAEV